MCSLRYAPSNSSSPCLACGKGTYAIMGGSGCKVCPAGSIAPNKASPECRVCGAGQYVADPGVDPMEHVTCQVCGRGMYNDHPAVDAAKHSSCTVCPLGQFNDHNGRHAYDHLGCAQCPRSAMLSATSVQKMEASCAHKLVSDLACLSAPVALVARQ